MKRKGIGEESEFKDKESILVQKSNRGNARDEQTKWKQLRSMDIEAG